MSENLLALFDKNTPTSLANCLPVSFTNRAQALLEKIPEAVDLLHDEEALLKVLKSRTGYSPTPTENRLRMGFWQEYEQAAREDRPMVLANVYSIVCGQSTFERVFYKTPERMAFLLSKPASYAAIVEETLIQGMKRLRSILELPDVDSKGRPIPKMLEIKMKITAMMDFRIHGAPTQKIEQKTLNLTATLKGSGPDIQQLVHKGDMKAIKDRIAQIEKEKRQLERQDVVVEGTTEPGASENAE